MNLKSTRFAKDVGSEEIHLDGVCVSKEIDNELDSDCSFTSKKDKSSKLPSTVCQGGGNDRTDSNRCLDNMAIRTSKRNKLNLPIIAFYV